MWNDLPCAVLPSQLSPVSVLAMIPVAAAPQRIDQALQLDFSDLLRLSQFLDEFFVPNNHAHPGLDELSYGGHLDLSLGLRPFDLDLLFTHGGHLHFGIGLLPEDELYGPFDIHRYKPSIVPAESRSG